MIFFVVLLNLKYPIAPQHSIGTSGMRDLHLLDYYLTACLLIAFCGRALSSQASPLRDDCRRLCVSEDEGRLFRTKSVLSRINDGHYVVST